MTASEHSTRHRQTAMAADLDALCEQLAANPPPDPQPSRAWLEAQWQRLIDGGVPRWFVPSSLGGEQQDQQAIVRGFVALGGACLTTTFVLTQWVAAVKRLVASDNTTLAGELLPPLLDGRRFVTVGLSHLTTSRQHVGRPVLRAVDCRERKGFLLDGYSPWVTAAPLATEFLIGATVVDDTDSAHGEPPREILAVIAADDAGVEVGESQQLAALSSSLTGRVNCGDVFVPDERVIAGPVPRVLESLSSAAGAFTGGPVTAALALGLASAAISFLEEQSKSRAALRDSQRALDGTRRELLELLLAAARGETVDLVELRSRANSLVLRATQAALTGAKGAGFVAGHPVERWCREALFFLVWSCPQAVQDANLCEFAAGATKADREECD